MAVSASGQGGLLVRVEPGQSDRLVRGAHVRRFQMRGREMDGWLRVDIEGVRTQPNQMRVDASQFVQQDPQVLGAGRDFELKQFLDGQAVRQIVGHRTQVVDAIGQRDHLLVELGFAGLLDSGMEISDIGNALDDSLAVDFKQ